jgi:hypothetical protein
MVILPVSSAMTFSGDDSKYLADLNSEGIPLLFEIPAVMKAGVFHGDASAIAGIAKEQSDALNAFAEKANGYSVSAEVKPLKDQVTATLELYKKDLTEYSTLNSSCGSCITKMNEIYPKLNGEAKKVMDTMIQLYRG